MRRTILAAAAVVLAFAGTAAGQSNPVYGVQPQSDPVTLTNGGSLGAPDFSPLPNRKQQAIVANALQQYQLACKPDQIALCSDRKISPADRCLAYHRLKLSTPCKQAMTRLEVAKRDLG